MTYLRYMILGLILCITGCHAAAPTEAYTVDPTPSAAPETYTVDATHSTALFQIKHFGISFVSGRFTDLSGTIVVVYRPLEESIPIPYQIKTTARFYWKILNEPFDH